MPHGTGDQVSDPLGSIPELPPPDAFDPVIEAYKAHVDRTLLRENLRLTPEQRLQKMISFIEMAEELRAAARRQES
jgi:hypothetical protein